MSFKKAIELLDLSIARNERMTQGFLDPAKSWNITKDSATGLAHTMADLAKDDIKVLELIKKQTKL